MKKKILILGSDGQIGSHLVNYLNKKKNYKILKFDIMSGLSFDLRNFNNKKLINYIKKSDFVFFLAPSSCFDRWLQCWNQSRQTQ